MGYLGSDSLNMALRFMSKVLLLAYPLHYHLKSFVFSVNSLLLDMVLLDTVLA
jgi:hypothetical protein